MFVELHILQNFAPANLNRDDTGMPKECEFGGYRRARISSQCFKRAIRDQFRRAGLLEKQVLGVRTKLVVNELVSRLEALGKDAEAARSVAKFTVGGVKLETGDDDKTQYLVFIGNQEIDGLASLCAESWDQLVEEASKTPTGRQTKSSRRDAVPKAVRDATKAVLDGGGRAVDLALFGRMLADLPSGNVVAASQVAHAISTNRLSMELDYYTAVDDLQQEDVPGAGMIGTVGFNSACFYRYSNLDIEQLRLNLQHDDELAIKSLKAFIQASVNAIPTGKQNSMAAHNPPSFVFAVVRRSQLWNLANAFLKPVSPSPYGEEDLAACSARVLDEYWGKLSKMYGDGSIAGKWAVSIEESGATNLQGSLVPNIDSLLENVLTRVGEMQQ